ncbi:hypothetical protein TVAG_401150 [Trichomonas vaginalis G3]|uniref:Uncharacterized protein n=1 Tax=Trichomonas vaginalis (strain ATCC PRA-98 / G3) TaxID=412133 RepID=A2E3M3_TRIV3|nr:hypothetical protein TVAGG3_0647150 [Trichomonas vaginalis G3]EAY12789.1 hypothetical protein TVAG_401150 [Trichomonas vaginalis G3]KAI5505588.1 hypothetical protein TVAGG3_0647150 [Trichomonas vaginalis G3]|eukprot:XP_001325012.1 hypothetical protein [Trichomonas vaginalis G3]
MFSSKVPHLSLPISDKNEVPFIVWDPALEDLLSTPINRNLTTPNVKWKPSTALNKTDFMRSDKKRARTRPATPTMHVEENSDMRSREIMIHKMITSPLSPRKPTKIRAKTKFHGIKDQHTLEKVIHQRATRSIANQDLNARKVEKQSLVRQFSIPIRRGVTSPNPFL